MFPEDLKEVSIHNCRACLKPGDFSIFPDILENFIEFGGIEIRENDNLPRYLCNRCHLLLEAAVLFREKVRKANKLLKNVNNIESGSENDEQKDEHILKFRTSAGHKYLSREKSNTKHMKLENEESLSDDSSDNYTKSEKEYLVVKYETDEESDSNMDNDEDKNAANMAMSNKNQQKAKTDEFACAICYMNCKTMGELENHNELEHKIKVMDKMNCAVCGLVVSKACYKVHLKLHREKFKMKLKKHHKVQCKVCNKLVNRSYYPFHLKMHGSDRDKAARKRQCKICNKTFSMHYYNDHMKRVHMVAPNGDKLGDTADLRKQKHIQCVVCDKSIREHKYEEHLANHGKPARKYICDRCGKEFIYRSGFIVHLLTHGSELKHKCKFCDYQAVHQGLLKVHVRIHTKDYNYKCTECPARFTTKSNLSQHTQRHKGPGHIKCYECDRMFHRKRNMEEHHKTIHLKIKDVICDVCGKGFSHRDRMLSHQLKVHNRDRFPKQNTASYLKIKGKL